MAESTIRELSKFVWYTSLGMRLHPPHPPGYAYVNHRITSMEVAPISDSSFADFARIETINNICFAEGRWHAV